MALRYAGLGRAPLEQALTLANLWFNDSFSCLVLSFLFYKFEANVIADAQGLINMLTHIIQQNSEQF